MRIRDALTFDDVLLQPQRSEVVPLETQTSTRISRSISVGIPLMSAAMDTVTEAPMAITMAQAGGIGVVHKNLSIEEQAAAVLTVKKYESGMVINPVTINPGATLADAMLLMQQHRISGIPVVEPGSEKLVGILTNRDVRFARDQRQTVAELMTHQNLITVTEGCERDEAERLLHQHRIEKLLVVDEAFRCVGLITVKDIEKAQNHPNATKDAQGRLKVAAATFSRPCASLVALGWFWAFSMSLTVIRPTQRNASSTTSSFSIRCWWSRRSASSRSQPSVTVIRFWWVISSATVWRWSRAKRTSRLVRMPTSFSLPGSTTGMPLIRCCCISSMASASVAPGLIVTGLMTMPDSYFFTVRTAAACSSMLRFLCTTPMPPACAMVMAMGASVTVSMAADISGIPTLMLREMRVLVWVSSGTTSERWGWSRTSSKVSASRILMGKRSLPFSLSA